MMDGGKSATVKKRPCEIKRERRAAKFVRRVTVGGRGSNQPPYRKPGLAVSGNPERKK